MDVYIPSHFSSSVRPLTYMNAPIAVSNKIRAIRARKDRSVATYVRSEIHPLNTIENNLTNNNYNSQILKERLTAEKLFDRKFKLDRVILQQQPTRLSVLSSNPSLLWPSYGTAVTSRPRRSQSSSTTTITPPIESATPIKSNQIAVMPDILLKRSLSRPQTKASLIQMNENKINLSDVEQPFIIVKEQDKKMFKNQSLTHLNRNFNNINKTNAIKRTIITAKRKTQSPTPKRFQTTPYRTMRIPEINDCDNNSENKNDEEEIVDEEFQKYLPQAIEKCANWLIRYVFVDQDENKNVDTDI
ncbi:unnamed protein product [Didymodactylos carnosus]|uniref:Uncharacterized protein n=1 Tax=Didymodactylos carnosus TaxID=1234261 RepID=A0A8S2DFH2_9BILA|nr:unnamed protein product [Didymodactylos carnosus]CAF0926911.1 unnamed protein product [Didymodactylos carnosus]CAF3703858.1 unnamed protein product [Didymodactylos carnosus]CAF3703871.1 unnamed protein product [Didymodactylos carnosus]